MLIQIRGQDQRVLGSPQGESLPVMTHVLEFQFVSGIDGTSRYFVEHLIASTDSHQGISSRRAFLIREESKAYQSGFCSLNWEDTAEQYFAVKNRPTVTIRPSIFSRIFSLIVSLEPWV